MDIENIKLTLFEPTLKYPDPDLIMFYKALETRDIWLDMEINWDNCAFIVQYIKYLNTHESDDMTPIKIHIMSNGGELSTMFAVYHAIKDSKIPVYTYNEGACHSAAFLIYLAGDKRYMTPDALFIAHEGSGGAAGTFRESKAAMKQYELEVARMAELISSETNLTVDEINHNYDMNADWYIRHDDAVKFGIVRE